MYLSLFNVYISYPYLCFEILAINDRNLCGIYIEKRMGKLFINFKLLFIKVYSDV